MPAGHPLLSILPLVNGRSIATSAFPKAVVLFGSVGTALRAGGAPPKPRAFVLFGSFGTALRAGGAPPLYPAFARARHRVRLDAQRELHPLRTSSGLFGAANASQGNWAARRRGPICGLRRPIRRRPW